MSLLIKDATVLTVGYVISRDRIMLAIGLGILLGAICAGLSWFTVNRRAANRAASVLLSDFALQPGARVLLRGANGPMLSALWLAVDWKMSSAPAVPCAVPVESGAM